MSKKFSKLEMPKPKMQNINFEDSPISPDMLKSIKISLSQGKEFFCEKEPPIPMLENLSDDALFQKIAAQKKRFLNRSLLYYQRFLRGHFSSTSKEAQQAYACLNALRMLDGAQSKPAQIIGTAHSRDLTGKTSTKP